MKAEAMGEGESVWEQKARRRAAMREQRGALPEADYAAACAAIRARLLTLPALTHARTVHAYWPLLGRREVDLRPLIDDLRARGVTVVLPVVVPRAPGAAPHLHHRRYDGPGRLRPGPWGLMEPDETPEVAPNALDVILVPALAAARDGTRLGYGAGFYDAFLVQTGALRVCPVFSFALAEGLPAEPHDQRMDVVVTERETVWVRRP